MPIGPTIYNGEERVFVDREACIQAFRKNIQNYGTREYNVLFYHGIAGVGKSKLQKELQEILNEEYPEIVWASIDLDTKNYREVGTFLITLRNKIQEKCKAKFYLFNIAHAIYWKKLHPEIPLQQENYPLFKEEGFFNKIVDVLNEVRPGPLEFIPVRYIFEIINNAPDSVKKIFKEQTIDIDKLTVMEAHEIKRYLPGFFAADFTSYLGANSKAYIFIDTYEALWKGLRDKGSFHEKDEWIRDNLIPNMQGVSWIICGKEKLLWDTECDPEWEMYLDQHPIDELPEKYCQQFLEHCGIENKDIRDIVIKASEGVPYYLNLSVDTFEKISKKKQPVSENFGKTQREIFNTFVKDLEGNEIRALKVLSAPNFCDRELFEILMKKFDPGFPIGAFSELIKFSFIKMDTDGRYTIHQLMRTSLQEYQDSIDRENVHKFIFEYYNNKLKDIDIKSITPEHEIALTEAFYHAKETLETKDLLNWFIDTSNSFNRAAFWQLIAPMYEEMLQIFEKKLGMEHPHVATTLNNLAELYHQMGKYKEALLLHQRALEIRGKALGPQNPEVANTLNDMAWVYFKMGEYEKSLPFYQQSLEIREKILGPEHPSVAHTLNNMAVLYRRMAKYEEAVSLCQRSLEIKENTLGPSHPSVAPALNTLATVYKDMGKYEMAVPLCQRALKIKENTLEPSHPSIALTLNILASVYERIGKSENALLLYLQALHIREKVLGTEHPDTAKTLNDLASLYRNMGESEKALPLYQQSLEIREKILGQEHPDVAETLNSLAELYESMGKSEKAQLLYQRALEIRESLLGPEHPDTARTLSSLAGLYKNMENNTHNIKH